MKVKKYPPYYPSEYWNGENLIFPVEQEDNLSMSDKVMEDWEYGGGEFSLDEDIAEEKRLKYLTNKYKDNKKPFKNQQSKDLRDLYFRSKGKI